ncbi:cytochrome d ubiquinol oxidase subunit II [Sphaerotilus hippei]|nr:cytochrome d ubiquinol oxidase subunit II [Sphaerotilus hippei]
MDTPTLLPVIFLALMGLSMLAYVVLDGYDLGVGLLMPLAGGREQDTMVASIGPFWDANETWLVLGVGLLLIAFPKAQGVVLGALYLPVALMLIGLILRGVAFDFRVKARAAHQPAWNRLFSIGSLLASLAQGWMLGRYITGFAEGAGPTLFAAVITLALPAAYALLGATWLIMKTDGALQVRAVRWARLTWPGLVLGVGLISVVTPWVSEAVRQRWFSMPGLLALLPIPLMSAFSLLGLRALLNSHRVLGKQCWLPFVLVVLVFVMAALGLAYSLYPDIVPGRLSVWQAAAATESLQVILAGSVVSVPAIVVYTAFVYRIFHGKATALRYA